MNKEQLLLSLIDRLLGSPSDFDPAAQTNIPLNSYVIVRCRDAGVHAGILVSYNGRQAELTQSRRLWKWNQAKGALLSGVANYGLDHEKSIVGSPIDIILTETCEIIRCSDRAADSIKKAPNTHE